MNKNSQFSSNKGIVLKNLETIKTSLIRCVNEGMIDVENTYYNELLELMENARIVNNWDELLEIISRGTTLEMDIAAWLSMQGRTTVSLSWPKKISTNIVSDKES